jgi:NitT/TauT family transport system permease protein
MTATDAVVAIDDPKADTSSVATIDAADMPASRKAIRTPAERLGRGVRAALPPLAVFAVIVGIWYIANAILPQGQKFLVPTLDQVIVGGFGKVGPDILIAVGRTTGVALTGLGIAAALGIAWAVAMSLARWIQRSTYPYAVILQCIPILALVPLIGVWFGFEFNARVVVCVMISLFPIVASTLFGLQSVERSQHELFRLQKAKRWTVLSKLMFPAALPSIFLGLRTSAGLSVVGAIVGDFFFQRGTPGVGTLLQIYARQLLYPQLFAAIITSALLGVVMFFIFGLISRLAVGKWYDPVTSST